VELRSANQNLDHVALIQQHSVMCNLLHLVERRTSGTPDTVDINRENTVTWLGTDAGQNEQL